MEVDTPEQQKRFEVKKVRPYSSRLLIHRKLKFVCFLLGLTVERSRVMGLGYRSRQLRYLQVSRWPL